MSKLKVLVTVKSNKVQAQKDSIKYKASFTDSNHYTVSFEAYVLDNSKSRYGNLDQNEIFPVERISDNEILHCYYSQFSNFSIVNESGTGDAATLNGQDGAYYRNRINHTGTQPINTVSGLQASLDSKASEAYVDTQINSLVYISSVRGGTNISIDNTDPKNPIINAALTSGVESVTGTLVDNSDPSNPVINLPSPSDIGAISVGGDVSDLVNDAGYITISDIPLQQNSDWDATSGVSQILNKPDLSNYIQSGDNVSDLNNDVGYIDVETDPTVPAHVKSITTTDIDRWDDKLTSIIGGSANVTIDNTDPQNPIISVSQSSTTVEWDSIGGDQTDVNLSGFTNDLTSDSFLEGSTNLYMTSSEKTKLSGIAAGAEVNVNADWDSSSGDSQILNKPNLGTAAQADIGDFATAAQGSLADTALQSITSGGANVTIDDTDPKNPIISVSQSSTTVDWDSIGGTQSDVNLSGFTNDLDADDFAAGTTNLFLTSAERTKLSGIEEGAQVNVKPDWDAASGNAAEILNKPTIPAAQVNSDWNSTSGVSEILNKPILGTASQADTGDFATAAQGLLADTAVQPADIALEEGDFLVGGASGNEKRKILPSDLNLITANEIPYNTGSGWSSHVFSTLADSSTIPLRVSGGQLRVGDPAVATDAVNLRSLNSVVQVSANKTLALSDNLSFYNVTAASTITIPTNTSVAFPIGAEITVALESGTATIVAASGVTTVSLNNNLTLDTVGQVAVLKKTGTDKWFIGINGGE